jgi:hypothetical protein
VTTTLSPDPNRAGEPGPVTFTSLYARILGANWERLAGEVRAAHFAGRTIERRGLFQVRRGEGLLNRMAATLMRLPAASEGVPIQLRIEGNGEHERWIRHFGLRRLTTFQRGLAEGTLLGERFGPLELVFRLEAVDGCLCYRMVGARLRLGPLGIPLPRGLRPEVAACESTGAAGATNVMVDVALPVIGRLIRYEGLLYCEPPAGDVGRVPDDGIAAQTAARLAENGP